MRPLTGGIDDGSRRPCLRDLRQLIGDVTIALLDSIGTIMLSIPMFGK